MNQLFDVLKGISNQRLVNTIHNTKIGIYEFMDREEVLLFQNTSSSKFKLFKN